MPVDKSPLFKISPKSSRSSRDVGIQNGSSSNRAQCEKINSGAVTSPLLFWNSSGARPKASACGKVAVSKIKSVPSTIESSKTFPRRLDRTLYNGPSPAIDECSVNLRWLSTNLAGLVSSAHRIADFNALSIMPPLRGLEHWYFPSCPFSRATSTASSTIKTLRTGSSQIGPALMASLKPAATDPFIVLFHISSAAASSSLRSSSAAASNRRSRIMPRISSITPTASVALLWVLLCSRGSPFILPWLVSELPLSSFSVVPDPFFAFVMIGTPSSFDASLPIAVAPLERDGGAIMAFPFSSMERTRSNICSKIPFGVEDADPSAFPRVKRSSSASSDANFPCFSAE
mmetsp:Transcript_24939/g.69990  ORF Transcript_24939/g.69990 Transcript_24939/m.69990 type:complete len:345 (-) Transcript_24939:174-1208(-)